jgi:DNA-binding LacI/PurR family transcriptional regulator
MPQQPGEVNYYLYEKIYTELKTEILSGAYKKGDWFPPERVLKDRFKTTHLTVRNALAKLVLEGFIERYSGKGTIVIYSPLRGSRQPPRLRVKHAHLVIGRVAEANAVLLNQLEEGLRRLSIPIRYSCHHDDALLEGSLCRQAAEADALVILEPAASPSSVFRTGTAMANTIIVNAMDESYDGPQVMPDDAAGAREAVRYLRELGYLSIAHVSCDPSFRGEEKRGGFEAALAGASGQQTVDGLIEIGSPGIEGGADACRRVLARLPACRAFFFATDEAAAGGCMVLREKGLLPGRDCSVIGFGDTLLAEAEGLMTVGSNPRRVAEQVLLAVREAATKGSFPRGIFLVKPELRVRASCCRAPHDFG